MSLGEEGETAFVPLFISEQKMGMSHEQYEYRYQVLYE